MTIADDMAKRTGKETMGEKRGDQAERGGK